MHLLKMSQWHSLSDLITFHGEEKRNDEQHRFLHDK